jgi:hypothetical protein
MECVSGVLAMRRAPWCSSWLPRSPSRCVTSASMLYLLPGTAVWQQAAAAGGGSHAAF